MDSAIYSKISLEKTIGDLRQQPRPELVLSATHLLGLVLIDESGGMMTSVSYDDHSLSLIVLAVRNGWITMRGRPSFKDSKTQ